MAVANLAPSTTIDPEEGGYCTSWVGLPWLLRGWLLRIALRGSLRTETRYGPNDREGWTGLGR
jgi:hypothetical protein